MKINKRPQNQTSMVYTNPVTTTATNNVEQIKKLWSSWKLHPWLVAGIRHHKGGEWLLHSHCSLITACSAGNPGLPPSAGQNEKHRVMVQIMPPEALLWGWAYLGPCPGAENRRTFTQFWVWDPTTELRHGKNSKPLKRQITSSTSSKYI